MKFYLSLIITLLIATTYQASSNGCGYVKIDYTVYPSTNCDNPNGMVFAKLSKNYTDYNFVWMDLVSNKRVSTASRNYAYRLKAGDYKLTVSPKDNPNCKISKEFFIHGKLIYSPGKCPDINMEYALESITVIQNMDGRRDFLFEGYKGENVVYRVNNPNERASIWNTVPKPEATGGIDTYFKSENNYEFAATPSFELSGFVISQPVRGNMIYENSSKLMSNLNKSLSISPQPATNYLNIELDLDFEVKSIEIMDLNGVNLIRQETSDINENLQLNVADLSSGLYIMKVNSLSESLTQKFIVK